jgi:hypothetical protein
MKKIIKKSQPKPSVKKYTASDSIAYVKLDKQIDRKIANTKQAIAKGAGPKKQTSMLNEIDRDVRTLRANPFNETQVKRKYAPSKPKVKKK